MKLKHQLQRVTYITKRGERRIYEYHRKPWPSTVDQCIAVLARGPLHREGNAQWRTDGRGRRFRNATVEKAIARGLAERRGDRVFLVIREAAE
ncbi:MULTISPECIES: hypothetical protein [unclassified Bradyrhizobium]|uniref:hypothetical protein n=1 Tax=unclassified Bradyrhizobium TaxID=2631580 RepID=UPI002916E72A|nr:MULTISPECIES: hypothetical protein [unclassified Bradyrhizobium]